MMQQAYSRGADDRRVPSAWSCKRRSMTCGFLVFLALCPIPLFAEEVPDVKAVLAVWKKKQESFRTGRFTWTETQTLKQGALMGQQKGAGNANAGKGAPSQVAPDKDMTITRTHKLIFDGEKVRYECKGKIWDPDKNETSDLETISVFDGETPKTLSKSPVFDVPRGWIRQSARNRDLWQMNTTPLLLVYRPFHSDLRDISPDKLATSDQPAVIEGKASFALTQPINEEKRAQLVIWAAHQLDYPVMRMQETVAGTMLSQIDFSYAADEANGEVVSGWKYVRVSPSSGAMLQSSSCLVREYELNRPIDPKEFQLNFPAGTFVNDARPQKGASGEFYMVRDDQSERPVSRPELVNNTFEQLLTSDNREDGKRRTIFWLLFLGLGLGFGFIVFRLWRGRQRNAPHL